MKFRTTNMQGTHEVRNNAEYLLGWVVQTPNGKWVSVTYSGLTGLDHWGRTFAAVNAMEAYEKATAEWEKVDFCNGRESREAAALDWLDQLTSNRQGLSRSTFSRPREERTPGQKVPTTQELMDLLAPVGWANTEDPHAR